ncbi:5'-nucleotidase domain-containing protein 1 [Nematostella vectensis]|uniref:5'-nucleotidase domain-containing protein 1 n=1 Tax=Nematostella vectensis TaxID=45351 RepID=UPI00138FC402|nr:5'-nucleotidase domain-containing protein 1 [Nematostella vectensis]
MVKLTDYDSIGFDLDHTVIQYKLGNVFELIYKCITEFLVEEKGYDDSLLQGSLSDYSDFVMRGHIFDIEKGNILKLDNHGVILRASHGTNHLNKEEIRRSYGEKAMFPLFNDLKENMIVRHRHIVNFRTFENFFDIPGSLIAARLVDIIDKKHGRPTKYTFWPDVMSGFILNFSPSSFSEKKGKYFPTITQNPSNFIKLCSPEVLKWIKSLSTERRKVFLLTNSYIDYAGFLLEYAAGNQWKDLFDVVVCKASKPGFFVPYDSGMITPFYEIEDGKEIRAVDELHLGGIYSQGNNKTFMQHIRKWIGKANPRVLYFGDSAKSDIYPTFMLARWESAAVLEEMETEGMVTLHPPQGYEENGEPKRKRAKLVDIEIEEGKDEVLLSRQWGSLFTDDGIGPDVDGNSPDATKEPSNNKKSLYVENKLSDECNGIPGQEQFAAKANDPKTKTIAPDILDAAVVHMKHTEAAMREFEAIDSTEVREMNTFWGDMFRRCSTIAIPTLDFIASLPADHEFGTFDAVHSGFYPGVPKSLHKN